MKPVDELVAAMVSCLDNDFYKIYKESVVIRQRIGVQSRELVEAMALLDVIRIRPQKACSSWI